LHRLSEPRAVASGSSYSPDYHDLRISNQKTYWAILTDSRSASLAVLLKSGWTNRQLLCDALASNPSSAFFYNDFASWRKHLFCGRAKWRKMLICESTQFNNSAAAT
jgi:hypothetical protein